MTEGEKSTDERDRDGCDLPLLADDEFYRTLVARPRRRVLAYLLECERSTVAELADVICGCESSDPETVSPDGHEQVRIALTHMHLPHLADAGLVTYDRETGRVALASLGGPVRRLVRRSIEVERP